jgi:hypothetical protein
MHSLSPGWQTFGISGVTGLYDSTNGEVANSVSVVVDILRPLIKVTALLAPLLLFIKTLIIRYF